MTADPARIGRYKIEAVLGRGAMGVIYKAHDPEIDRVVAIKLIRADLLDGEDRADYLIRFRREAQAAGRCVHPNIVTIYDFATHEGNPFLAMEFVDGISLTQAYERGTRFEPADAAFVILQVLAALGAMHALGIVHRDIKPANILLTGGAKVKVTDFGISRLDTSELTQNGLVIGTPSYMSPEQCRGDPVDTRSDLFSSGAVLYELLCGERPFAGRNYHEIARRLLLEAPPDLCERSIAVSPALRAVVDRALAKSPAARFATAAEMTTALQAAMVGHPSTMNGATLDRTTIVSRALPSTSVRPSPTTATGSNIAGRLDREALDSLQRRLAQHVGPIARHLVQSAISKAETVEGLCESLAGNIAQPDKRDEFQRAALQQLRRAYPAASPTKAAAAIPQAELDCAQAELSRLIGPIARVLVRRNAAVAASSADFWHRLSLHVERESDRRSFLARRGT